MITQRSSSVDPHHAGVLEAPLLARGRPSGASSGSEAIDQPSTPFADRATLRWEMPRRSSTRASRTVSPFDGGRSGVEHRVDGIRPVLRGQDRVARVPAKQLVIAIAHAAAGERRASRDRRTDAGRVEEERGTVECEGRFGAFVLVEGVPAEPVAASSGCEVVERLLQPVAAEEPLEGARRTDPVLRLAGDGERGELGLDRARRRRAAARRPLPAPARPGSRP